MKHRVMIAVLTLSLMGCAAAPAPQAPPDEAGATAANAAFYSALNVFFTGDAGPMKAVWSHADDVSYMGPGGEVHVGWAAVEADWDRQAAMKLGGAVAPRDVRMHLGQDLAVFTCVEAGENNGPNGTMVPVSIRATNTFRRENGVWKMVGHHTDLLPFITQ